MFAQLPSPTSPEAVGWITLTVFAVAGGFYYLVALYKMLRPKEPLQVRDVPAPHVEFATNVALDKLRTDFNGVLGRADVAMEKLRSDLNEGLEAADHRRSESIAGVHRKLDEFRGSIERKIQDIERSLGRIEGKINGGH